MHYDDVDEDRVPEAVEEEIVNLLELDRRDLIQTILAWGPFYGCWAGVCREQPQSDRLRRINDGTCQDLAAGYTAAGDVWTGTLMTAIWCMPDAFLDDVLRIHDAIRMASRVH